MKKYPVAVFLLLLLTGPVIASLSQDTSYAPTMNFAPLRSESGDDNPFVWNAEHLFEKDSIKIVLFNGRTLTPSHREWMRLFDIPYPYWESWVERRISSASANTPLWSIWLRYPGLEGNSPAPMELNLLSWVWRGGTTEISLQGSTLHIQNLTTGRNTPTDRRGLENVFRYLQCPGHMEMAEKLFQHVRGWAFLVPGTGLPGRQSRKQWVQCLSKRSLCN